MPTTKYLKGSCQTCGGRIEFPAEGVGTSIECPHCGKTTELMLDLPPDEPMIPRSTIIWTAVTILLLVLGLFGALAALKRAEKKAAERRQEASAAEQGATIPSEATPPQDEAVLKADFRSSPITLQNNPGTSLVHATGTLTNVSPRQRFGVKIVLDLFDESGVKVGQATDYQQVVEPGAQWSFHASVVYPKAVTARIQSIKEQQ